MQQKSDLSKAIILGKKKNVDLVNIKKKKKWIIKKKKKGDYDFYQKNEDNEFKKLTKNISDHKTQNSKKFTRMEIKNETQKTFFVRFIYFFIKLKQRRRWFKNCKYFYFDGEKWL